MLQHTAEKMIIMKKYYTLIKVMEVNSTYFKYIFKMIAQHTNNYPGLFTRYNITQKQL